MTRAPCSGDPASTTYSPEVVADPFPLEAAWRVASFTEAHRLGNLGAVAAIAANEVRANGAPDRNSTSSDGDILS